MKKEGFHRDLKRQKRKEKEKLKFLFFFVFNFWCIYNVDPSSLPCVHNWFFKFQRAQLIPLATAQALAAANNNHSRPCFSRTLPKHCDVKEYIEAFLFMD